ncbi:hypothetical protein L6452_30807 [Arctium lappa]|uniref:Uncharacterized protein n=1 Tax=Arctium lappa TaxID=4217 RepID=A0ACB8ZK75_ARCLA|nr:hypothetical protein L6452_30807 [Arctium lappa]
MEDDNSDGGEINRERRRNKVEDFDLTVLMFNPNFPSNRSHLIYRRSTIFLHFLLQFIKCYTKPWLMLI